MSKAFAPTPAELALVNQIFAKADTQGLGVLTGDVAVDLFAGSGLASTVLGEVWQLSDNENTGFLTRKGVAIAVRLMGHAQKGEKVTEGLINKPGPLPTIKGVNASTTTSQNATPRPMSPAFTGLPALTPQDKTKFAKIFAGCGPVSGLVSGEKARDVFLKSKLPVDKLSQIWNLADTKSRGSLDLADFTVGMYLIQACMSGQLSFVPTTLPPGLYEQAGGTRDPLGAQHTGSTVGSPGLGGFPGRPGSALHPQTTGGSTPSLQPQYTGQGAKIPQQYTGQGAKHPGPPIPPRNPAVSAGASAFGLHPQMTGQQVHWDVTPTEKANADKFFDTLDPQRRGFIEGDVAVPFMLQSNLPEEVLAQVWDLADGDNDGRLNRDDFAVAMHLIQGKLAGRDVPSTLPESLIPPSARASRAPAPVPSNPLQDLLWDDPPAQATSQPPPPFAPPASALSPAQTGRPISPPQPRAVTMPMADPFGSSSFGPASLDKDLLGDSDDDVPSPASPPSAPAPAARVASPPFQDRSAEIGNTQNQLNSTNRSLEATQAERTSVEQRLSIQAAELSSLQTQLSSAKAAYETETKLLATLRDRFNTQNAEIQKAREELIRAESDLSAMRVEKGEIEGGLLRDKEDVRGLQRQMKEVGTETDMLKLDIEKIKKEAKQQKGLLAIAKKQLSAKEADRAKVEKELEEAKAELAQATKEREEVEAELAKEPEPTAPPATVAVNGIARVGSPDSLTRATQQPLPLSPDITGASVAPSFTSPISPTNTGKSNNPFERLAASSAVSPRAASPFAMPFSNAALPTPPTGATAEVPAVAPGGSDPFGFSQAFETEAHEPEPAVLAPAEPLVDEPQQATPKQAPAVLPLTEDVVISPASPTTTDFFQTPPSTANGTIATKEEKLPAQPVSATSLQQVVPGGFPADDHDEADLMSNLKEKDLEESDSDSDDEDEVPLANLVSKGKEPEKAPALPPMPSSAFDDAFGDSHEVNADATPKIEQVASPFGAPAPAAAPTFTDVFGAPFAPTTVAQATSPPPAAVTTNGAKDFDDAFGVPNKSDSLAAATTGGAKDFDDAFGVPSKSDSSAAAPFSFDNAFEESFDFGSTPAAVPTAAPTFPEPTPAIPQPQPAFAGAPQLPPVATTRQESFDDVFGVPAPATTGHAPPASGLPAEPAQKPFSFDAAFGAPTITTQPSQTRHGAIDEEGRNLSLSDGFSSTISSSAPTIGDYSTASSRLTASSQFQPPPGPPPGSGPNQPQLPTSPPRGSSASAVSVGRPASPPPRQQSPRPRLSNSSANSAEKQDKQKEAKHSRLSQIRLPFGKKRKNTQEPLPAMPSTHLSPPSEEPERGATPAADDDVGPVKQLVGMGFSRRQAVEALEKYDYDVQRALNSLLGAQ